MTYSTQLKIPAGYTVKQVNKIYDIDEAVSVLKSRKGRKYISARRLGDDYLSAELRKDVWKCPYCNFERSTASMVNTLLIRKRHPVLLNYATPSIIEKWGSRQTSMFENDCGMLYLNHAPLINGEQICPKCNRTSLPSLTERDVWVNCDENRLEVRAEICSVDELLCIPWIKGKEITIHFPIYESIIFDVEAGDVHIELQGADGTAIAKRDIADQSCAWEKGIVYRLIRDNVTVSRPVKRFFAEKFGGKLPFGKYELVPEKYVIMTGFTGFPENFYNAVPYIKGSYLIDESFDEIVSKLRRAENIPSLFNESELPKCKSVKRIFFNNTGFFFYLAECEKLWKIIGDVNYFCQLMSDDDIFTVLSTLHQRPRLFDYVSDYSRVKGARAMIDKICVGWKYSIEYAVDYCSMSEVMKKAVQEKWRKRPGKSRYRFFDHEEYTYHSIEKDVLFSIPMNNNFGKVKDCVIDGFSFSRLRSGNDYLMAGRALDNCLINWNPDDSPVVIVRHAGVIKAAIEISCGRVKQIQGISNTDISLVNGLQKAYDKWRERFELKDKINFGDEHFDILPRVPRPAIPILRRI